MGFLKDIQDMPNQYEYSLKFFDRYYRPEYTTIIVVGDVKPKAVRALVDKYWGEWKRGSYKPEIPVEPAQNGPRTAHVDWPSPTLPIVAVAFKAPAYNDATKETAALDALAYLAFSNTRTSTRSWWCRNRRWMPFRRTRRTASIPSLFEITARVKKAEDVDYVRDQILETVKAFQEKPVDAARLDAVRKRLRYQVALSMDNSDTIAQILCALRGAASARRKR